MKKIFVVEDNRLNVMLFESIFKLLSGIDYKVSDGEDDVIKIVEDYQPDLVIMDMHLPNIRGDVYIKQIREKGFTMPIIAATAYEIHSEKERVKNIGATEFISKPINVERFKALIEKNL